MWILFLFVFGCQRYANTKQSFQPDVVMRLSNVSILGEIDASCVPIWWTHAAHGNCALSRRWWSRAWRTRSRSCFVFPRKCHSFRHNWKTFSESPLLYFYEIDFNRNAWYPLPLHLYNRPPTNNISHPSHAIDCCHWNSQYKTAI